MIKFGVKDGSIEIPIGIEPQVNGDVFILVDGSYLVTFRAGDNPTLVVAEKWLKEKGITVEIQAV
jgi:hypothetical protein